MFIKPFTDSFRRTEGLRGGWKGDMGRGREGKGREGNKEGKRVTSKKDTMLHCIWVIEVSHI